MRFQRNDTSLLYTVVSDVHVPYQDQHACDAVGELMRDIQPDGLVINGDFWDLIEVSKHARGSVAELEGLRIKNSTKACNDQLDAWLSAAGPQCKHNHFVDGNHESRLHRWMTTGDNAVWLDDDATDIGKRLKLEERNFVYHRGYPDAYCRLGRLIVTHGRWTNKYCAAKHMDAYGHAIMVGHAHTPQMFYGSALNKQKAGYVNGHLADVESRAMKYAGKPNAWCSGFALVQVEPNKTFHVTQINFAAGTFYYGGRRYGRKSR